MIKFSIILATRSLIDSPFFKAIADWPEDKNSELIIVDSSWRQETMEKLKNIKKVKQIIYIPPIREPYVNAPRFAFRRDFNRALNSALIVAENEYIIRVDDYLILKDDFFRLARADVEIYRKRLIIAQKSHENENQEPWVDYFSKHGFYPGKRYVEINNPFFTWSFGIAALEVLLAINGWDERYDIGYAGEDSDILARYAIYTKKKPILDKYLMGYGLRHDRVSEEILPARWIFEATYPEIKCGKTWAYNPINLSEVRRQLKNELREKFLVR